MKTVLLFLVLCWSALPLLSMKIKPKKLPYFSYIEEIPQEVFLIIVKNLGIDGLNDFLNLSICSVKINYKCQDEYLLEMVANMISYFDFPILKYLPQKERLYIIACYRRDFGAKVNAHAKERLAGKFPILKDKKIVSYVSEDSFYLILTSQGEVYYWKYHDNINVLKLMNEYFEGKKAIWIWGNTNLSYILDNEGGLYSFGKNYDGHLGLGSAGYINNPTRIKGDLDQKKVVFMQARYNSSLALTSEGKLYSWGSNRVGELGLGHFNHVSEPHLIKGALKKKKVICVQIVNNSRLALTDEGELYSWGYIKYYRLSSWRISKAHGKKVNKPIRIMGSGGRKKQRVVNIIVYGSGVELKTSEGGFFICDFKKK